MPNYYNEERQFLKHFIQKTSVTEVGQAQIGASGWYSALTSE
jgi:hypothetical protein